MRVLITGASRGIGLEFTKQLVFRDNVDQIIATCRSPESAFDLLDVAKNNKKIQIKQLDISCGISRDSLKSDLGEYQKIDCLLNVAGISGKRGYTIGDINKQSFFNLLDVNTYSTLKLSEELLPFISSSNDKLIVCMSSRMGSIAENESGRSYDYRASKAALNCVMRSFAVDVKKMGVKVMLVHPGWVKTDMGGEKAPVLVEDSVKEMLALIEKKKPNSHAEVLWNYNGERIGW